ncbi:hypothetical protein [Rhodoferax mekongensis]|uniref:CopG family transcriptional regulator n=1 Tax=Rhodoferax mekongensis TaxID=3068341 RepID=A0ABZ0B240_9BURK|nr:hypothetical protein [Rhodoferax sp. TBRC 17307]WNO05983.1 hypothetical protein RAN89_06025 [Rhodoferax sp. TBRC 17307]
MVDDTKHTEAIKAFFTEREFLDICRIAAREDRKPGELVRVIVRRAMYGTIGSDKSSGNGANRVDEGSHD